MAELGVDPFFMDPFFMDPLQANPLLWDISNPQPLGLPDVGNAPRSGGDLTAIYDAIRNHEIPTPPGMSPDEYIQHVSGLLNRQPSWVSGLSGLPPAEQMELSGTMLPSLQSLGLGFGPTGAGGGFPWGKAALAGGGALLAAGLAQQFLRGSPSQQTEIQRQIAAMSPEERQLFQQAVSGTQRASEFAFGLPGQFEGLGAQTQGLQPLGVAAAGQATQGLSQAAGRMAGLTAPIEDRLASDLQTLPATQYNILSALGPAAAGMAQGKLALSPELSALVESAFTPGIGRALIAGLEDLRRRGFPVDLQRLLQEANLAPALGQSLSDIQGQMAGEKLRLAQSLPVAAAQIAGAYNQPFANQATAFGNLGMLNRNLQSALGDVGNTLAFQNPNEFLRTATGLGSGAADIGGVMQRGRLGSAGQTSLTQMPSPGILDTITSLGPLLSGIGTAGFGLSGGKGF